MLMQVKNIILALLLLTVMPIWSQEGTDSAGDTVSTELSGTGGQGLHEAAYIGMKLNELLVRFGPPRSVHVSRGQELWQDDVVFVYDEGDFYIFKDRVWQAGLKSACGVTVGDLKPAVVLTLGGEAAEVVDGGDYILFPLPPAGWPLTLRVNFNAAGRVTAIYIYRPDF